MQEQKKHDIAKLNELYTESDQCDREHFAEQRSNLLLVAGEHYSKRGSKYWNKIRDSKEISQDQKLRITKNHIQKITKTYRNNIISHAPSVKVCARNEKELQDQKAAELNEAVWQDLRLRHNLKMKTHQWCADDIEFGEVATKIFWNPSKGKFIGYEAEMDEMGQPLMDEQGQLVPSKTPRFAGDIEYERIWAFNLLRAANAKSMEESPYLIVRKMVSIEDLKALVGDDEEKRKLVHETNDETYYVFDGNQQTYRKSENQVMLKEYYFRACNMYPQGYYYITVQDGILFEGELPFGIFPIVYSGFDEVATTPRHKSIIKHLRPYQAEINRTASMIAETQVTSSDKLLIQSGTKITNGGTLPGVRALQYSGAPPTVMMGRSGEQYLPYMQSQISEMYSIANVVEDSAEKDQKGIDPFGALFTSIRNKKKFSIYGEKFEAFLKEVCKISLELAKNYYPDDMLIPAVGKTEYINIAEFKNSEPLCYQIKLQESTDDVETLFGKQLAINHVLQYVGNTLPKEDIGKLVRVMPFGNLEESFSDLTMDYDTATNMILALDRGDNPIPNKYDNAEYMTKRLVSRQRAADFAMLDPAIQSNYQRMVQLYEDILVQRQQEIKAAQSDFIPSGGARIKADYYISDPKNPERPVRATLPTESIDWLIKRLGEQGSAQEQLASMNQGAVSEMASMYNQKNAAGLQGSNTMPPVSGLGLN